MTPPNILLIMTDQQRNDTIGALGNPMIKTPVLDRLVKEGTAFTRCYTPSPVCISARTATVTGMPPHVTDCTDNVEEVVNLPSFMEQLQAAGYQTHGVGKMHFGGDPYRLWGFDSRDLSEEYDLLGDDYRAFLEENGYGYVDEPHGVRGEMYYLPQPSQLPEHLHNTTWVADKSIDFLNQRDNARPFMLWTSFIKPHPPIEVPTPWNKLYRAPEMLPPRRPEGYEELLTFWNRVQNRYKGRDMGHDDYLYRSLKAIYYACISFIDYQIGRILDQLGNEIDNTLIIFTADHGELLGDYGSVGKRSMFAPSVNVPLIARYPDQFPAKHCIETPTTLLDLYPTLLASAGLDDVQVSPEGVPLQSLVDGSCDRTTVYSQFSDKRRGLYMAATVRYKYVYSAPDQKEWLFDLQVDPQETHNFAENPTYRTITRELRTRLIDRFRTDGYTQPLNDDNTWKVYDPPDLPLDHADAGLMLHDVFDVDSRLKTLGEYARGKQLPVQEALRFLMDEDPQ